MPRTYAGEGFPACPPGEQDRLIEIEERGRPRIGRRNRGLGGAAQILNRRVLHG
jgi:hypothetical protein